MSWPCFFKQWPGLRPTYVTDLLWLALTLTPLCGRSAGALRALCASAPLRLVAFRAQRPPFAAPAQPLRVPLLTSTMAEGTPKTVSTARRNSRWWTTSHVRASLGTRHGVGTMCLWLHGILRWICEEILAATLDSSVFLVDFVSASNREHAHLFCP